MKKLLLLLTFSLPALGQSNSVYNASTYGYTTQVTAGNTSTGSSSLRANPTAFAQGIPFLPYNLNASITLNRNAANQETVTPSTIANCYPNSLTCTLSSIFSFKHISGESVQSGTFGLQEAVNVAVAAGSGTVLVDATWQGPAGASLITAAKGSSNVMIQDNRNPSGATFYQWNGSAYVATGGAGSVTSVFGRTGVVVQQTGDYTCSQVTGCNSASGITSINGDTTAAQQINVSGSGLSKTVAGGVTTIILTGGGITGGVNAGVANQAGCYPSAGTTIGPCPNIYAVNPAMTGAQISTLFGSLAGSNTVFIPAGTPQALYTYNGQVPYDLRLGANYFQMPGVACDGKQTALALTITSGSNTTAVGALLTTADVGKTFFFWTRGGYAFGSTQIVWTPTLVSVVSTTATWSSNAPFSGTEQVYYGTDNLAAINTAMTQANSTFPLTIPTGCRLLVNGTILWNNNQVIVGRHLNAGGFIGVPGKDVIATTDTNGQSVSSGGTGLKGFNTIVGTEVDATLGYNLFSANGTLTVVPPIYRPAYDHTPLANHPCAPGWFVNCINSVGSITAASALMTVPAGVKLPAVGNTIVFPYLTKVFTTTVDAVNSGTRVVTLHAPAPAASTNAQAEWFAGSSVQTTTTAIAGTPTYPFTLQLSNAIRPIPGWTTNFAQHGHGKIQDFEFNYMGVDLLNNTIVVRNGPATVNGGAGYAGTNTIVPLNPCAAKFTQPWPVTPSINAGDSTPSGANWFPGECVGNAGIAFPQANGNVYAGTGLSGGFLDDLFLLGSAGPGSNSCNANSAAGIYIAGNNAPFGSHLGNLIGQCLQYDLTQGPASSGQHGVAAVGPTGFGNTIHNVWFFGAFPMAFVDFQGSDVTGINMNSTEISPYDGTAVGSSTCLQVGYTLDEQTGFQVTTSQFDQFHPYGCEPENGSHIELLPAVDIEGSHISFDTANFEGVPNVFGGDHFKCTNCAVHLPAIDYGSNNDFGVLDGFNAGYITNVWDTNFQFLMWGANARCFAFAGGNGPAIPCGGSGRDIGPSLLGTPNSYFTEGAKITPWMWDNNGNFDTNPMTTTGGSDPTALYWSASATCALGGAAQCQTANFFRQNNGFLYIGPFNQMSPIPYMLDATFKTISGASSFLITINAQDPGTGTCSAGFHQLFQGPVNTTTSFTQYQAKIDFTTANGCVLDVQFGTGSTTDTLVVDRFNFVPYPGYVRGPLTAPTYPGSCPASVPAGSWMGAFSGFTYFCDGTTVKRVAIT